MVWDQSNMLRPNPVSHDMARGRTIVYSSAPSNLSLRSSGAVKENEPVNRNQTPTARVVHNHSETNSGSSKTRWKSQHRGPIIAQVHFRRRGVPLESYGLLPSPLPNTFESISGFEYDHPQTMYYEQIAPTFPKRYCSDPTSLTTSKLKNVGEERLAYVNRERKNNYDDEILDSTTGIEVDRPSRTRSRTPQPPYLAPIGRKENQTRLRPTVTRMAPPQVEALWRNKAAASGIRISNPMSLPVLEEASVQNVQNAPDHPTTVCEHSFEQEKSRPSGQPELHANSNHIRQTNHTPVTTANRFLAHDWEHYDWMRDVLAFRLMEMKICRWSWEMIIPPYIRQELSGYGDNQLESAYDMARDTYLKYKDHAGRFNIKLVGDNEHVWLIGPDEAEIKFALLYYPAIMEYCRYILRTRESKNGHFEGKHEQLNGRDVLITRTFNPETTCVNDIRGRNDAKPPKTFAQIAAAGIVLPIESKREAPPCLTSTAKYRGTGPPKKTATAKHANDDSFTVIRSQVTTKDSECTDHSHTDSFFDPDLTSPSEVELDLELVNKRLETSIDYESTLINYSTSHVPADQELQLFSATNGHSQSDHDGDYAHDQEDENLATTFSEGDKSNAEEEVGLDPTWGASKRKKWRRQQRKRAHTASIAPVPSDTTGSSANVQSAQDSQGSSFNLNQAADEQQSSEAPHDGQESVDQTIIAQSTEAESSIEHHAVGESRLDNIIDENKINTPENVPTKPLKRKKPKGKKKKTQVVVFTNDGNNLSRVTNRAGSIAYCRAALVDRDFHLSKGTWHNYHIMTADDLAQRRCYIGRERIKQQRDEAEIQLNMWNTQAIHVNEKEMLNTRAENISDDVVQIKWHLLYHSAAVQLCNEQLGYMPTDPSLQPPVRDSGSDESFSHRDDLVSYFRKVLMTREELKPAVNWHYYHVIFRFRVLAISTYNRDQLEETRQWAINKLMFEGLGDEQDPSMISYQGTAEQLSNFQVKRIYGMIYWNACIKLVDLMLMLDDAPAVPIEDGPEKTMKERWAKEEWPHVPLPKMRTVLQNYREAVLNENDAYIRIIDSEEGERIGLLKSNMSEREFSRRLAAEKLRYWADKGANPGSSHDKNAEEVKANYYWLRALDFIMLCDRMDEYVRLERRKLKGKQRADPTPELEPDSSPKLLACETTKPLSPVVRPVLLPPDKPLTTKTQQELEEIGEQIKYCQQSLTTMVQQNSSSSNSSGSASNNNDMENEQRMMELLNLKITYLRARLSTLTGGSKEVDKEDKKEDESWVMIKNAKGRMMGSGSDESSGQSSSGSRSRASSGDDSTWTKVQQSTAGSRCSEDHTAKDVPEALRSTTPPPSSSIHEILRSREGGPEYWYYVDEFLDVKVCEDGSTWYLVKWWGNSDSEGDSTTWEEEKYLVDCEGAMERFLGREMEED